MPVKPSAENGGKSRVGLRQVAAIAGVSTATVSRVLNNPELVSETLRTRVSMVIEQLGWVPHAAARALASNRNGAIGAIFPALALGDFARAMDAMQDALAARNYLLLLARSQYNAELEFSLARKMVERGVEGLVLVGSTRAPEYERFLARVEIPIVNSFVYLEDATAPCVGPDNAVAMADMVDYLVSLGHRRFGLMAQTVLNNDRAAARRDGVRAALTRYGIAIPPSASVEGRWSIGEGRKLFRQLVDGGRPTALICGNSLLAVGAVLEAAAMGIRVPEQMSIVGYDDIELMSELPQPITTVRVASDEVGRVAAEMVADMVEEGVPVASRKIPSEVVVRATSGPAPAD